ncbi:hypothetical protein D3C71_2099300 [compost metagenome]
MNHYRVEQHLNGRQLELPHQEGVSPIAFELLKLATVLVSSRRDLVGDIAQLNQSGLVLLLSHESA